jgi:Flp pilus assembly protein TadB
MTQRLGALVGALGSRRRKAVLGPQLADAVSAIASGSRAGLSLQQAVELAAGQVPVAQASPQGGRSAASARRSTMRSAVGDRDRC